MKKVALKQSETKMSSQYTPDMQVLLHNRTYFAGQLMATTQGDQNPNGIAETQNNRNGDSVVAKGVNIKFYLENFTDRPNVTYKIIIFRYNTLLINAPQELMTDNEFWCGLDGTGNLANRLLDRPNSKNIRVLKTKIIRPTNQANYSIQTGGPAPTGPFNKSNYWQTYIKLHNEKIKYRNNDSVLVSSHGLAFAVVAFDTQNTPTISQVGQFMWQSTFYYKDP